jgi:hypothetical protein
MNYRIYLLNANNHVRAGESFSAENDWEAEEIALVTYENYSMSFHGVELWRGPIQIVHQTRDRACQRANLQELIDKRQERAAELEDLLERSFQCVRESRQLLAVAGNTRLR